jgi:phenylacetate-CoA ligase
VELYDEEGKIVDQTDKVARHMIVTNLVNHAQPLIRYEMNDLIALGEPCKCGSHFRTIDHILGRNDDILRFKTNDGKIQIIFPDLFSRWIITTSDAIREYQVFQKDTDSVDIHIELLEESADKQPFVIEQLTNRINIELSLFDISTHIEIHVVKIGQPANSAKFKRFIVNPE